MRRLLYLCMLMACVISSSCGGGNDDDTNVVVDPKDTVKTDTTKIDTTKIDTTKTDSTITETADLTLVDSGYINSYYVLKSVGVEYYDATYYSSALPMGRAKVSGRIYLSKDCLASGSVKGIVLVNHYTITKESECPSEDTNYYESMFAALGYAVVMPDYYGFGVTKNRPQTYLCEEVTAKQCIDMLTKTESWLKKRNISTGGKVYNVGYSQGGAVAMAVQKYSEAAKLDISETYAGAGPYDIDGTYMYIAKEDYTTIPVVVPLLMVGMDYAYNLNMNFSKIFKEPLTSNYYDWVVSKNYTTSEICVKMGTNKLSEILQPEYLDSASATIASFRKILKANSLVSGLTYKVNNPIYLFHSTQDEIVPTFNTYELRDKLRADGYNDFNLTVVTLPCGGHVAALLTFYVKCYYDLMTKF